MKIKALKGTRDYLPAETELRESMRRTIADIYRKNGFQMITTPAIEDIENLDKSDGGENLNLIFRIMKRGEKLNAALANGGELCDMGLRYDLTLPLSRYYAANAANLPKPFKVLQMDKVYRAENPQKGRLREFMQCDIDIIGDSSPDCETELIAVTGAALCALDIGEFTVHINDRSVLNALLSSAGFAESELMSVCITLDKLDKIGAEGVAAELGEKGFAQEAVAKLSEILAQLPLTLDRVTEIIGKDKTERLESIIASATAGAKGRYGIKFDISLVRGQGYYTGTVFEVRSENFGSSVAGGGRYDGLVGKFTGENIPACGFSIGFERIFSILCDMGRTAAERKKIALLYDGAFDEAYAEAERLREEYDVALYRTPKKPKGLLDRLKAAGFFGFCYLNGEIKQF